MLAIPHHSQVLSMAEIDSKEAQKKLKAGICFRISSHNKHTLFCLYKETQKKEVQEKKTSAINRAFLSPTIALNRSTRIDVIDIACKDYVQEVHEVSESGNSPSIRPYGSISRLAHLFTPCGGKRFSNGRRIDEFLEHDDSIPPGVEGIYDSEGDTVYLEELLSVINSDPNLPPSSVCEINVPEYAFLEGDDKLPVIIAKNLKDEDKTALIKIPIDPLDQEKTTFICPYGTFMYRRMPFRLCNAPGTFQRCIVAIFHDMIEKTMEVFMDDFLVFGDSFSSCLSHLDKMLQRCEDTNLMLNWEKCHFMVKKGIVLGHKISKSRIEVDKAKVDVIAKLSHPTTVKGIRSFLGHAGFYQ
ncbi:reverse transcriptase domain-containing protein [Tanacetum coccineum]